MTYATPEDVAAGFRPLTTAESGVAEVLLDRAETLLLAQVPSVPARVAAGTLAEALLVTVEAAMVERVFRNPNGRRQESKTIDDYTHSWTIDSAMSTGGLYLSDAELALLAPQGGRLRVGTARLGTWM